MPFRVAINLLKKEKGVKRVCLLGYSMGARVWPARKQVSATAPTAPRSVPSNMRCTRFR